MTFNLLGIKVKRLHTKAKLPVYSSDGAAGADVHAVFDDGYEGCMLHPGARVVIQTGLSFAIPEGYEIQVRPRSGLALKHGITVVNAPGTIDCDYRGELGVILGNTGGEPFQINTGDRIAQIVVAPVTRGQWLEVEELDETVRGAGGYGSTGV